MTNVWNDLRHLASHAAISLLAIAAALSLPNAAAYILFKWWPQTQQHSQHLIYAELVFAAILMVLLNAIKLGWDYRRRARMCDVASLVDAREAREGLSRWAKARQVRRTPWKRDLTILAVTGYGTFAASDSALRSIMNDCYELRVLLLNPYGRAAEAYAASHADPQAALAEMRRQVAASIAELRRLRGPGRHVVLRFYDEPPSWKLVFVGDQVWVRSCHEDEARDAHEFPEYVFALDARKPGRGFFPSFYAHFLSLWRDPRHPEYVFEQDELIFRDTGGGEVRRMPYPLPAGAAVARVA